MRYSICLLISCAFSAQAQHQHSAESPASRAVLLPGMGKHHHPIQTTNPETQKFFDQGLTLCFGFNHEEAIRSFARAAELDPTAAMPWWGMALAYGPNYNLPMEPEPAKRAWEAIQKARALSAGSPPVERDYIAALSARYSADPQADRKALDLAYANAMRGLMRKYPDDLDAAVLFAESLMDLNPWRLWSADGKAADGTPEIISTLELVLKRDPDHPGANHYYVHAIEASPHPERALASAERLKTLVPGAGHLVHMPGHIYLRTGDFESAAATNEIAVKADEDYLKRTSATGVYPLMYASHNIHFIAFARAEQGRYDESIAAARRLSDTVKPGVAEMPMLEAFVVVPYFVLLRFGQWDALLREPEPPATAGVWHTLWRYARAQALAGKADLPAARTEAARFEAELAKLPPDLPWGTNNTGKDVFHLASLLIQARLAELEHSTARALNLYRQAVAAQNALVYDEPPAWYYPVAESYGGALLRAGQAAEAEQVFRQALDQYPRAPRLLFGLWKSLEAQNRTDAAAFIQRQFDASWQRATITLAVAGL